MSKREYLYIAAAIATILALCVAIYAVFLQYPRNSSTGGLSPTSGGPQSTIPATQPNTTAPTATSAPPRPNTVIYQANWSGGSGGWPVGGQWAILDGKLLNNGSSQNGIQYGPIFAPFVPPIANYAVEASIQVVQQQSSPGFGIFVRAPTTDDLGYVGGISGYLDAHGYNDSATLAANNLSCDGTHPCNPFDPGNSWHTYRLEVRGNSISYYIDGGFIVQLKDNQYLDPGRVGILCGEAQIAVRSFKVIAL